MPGVVRSTAAGVRGQERPEPHIPLPADTHSGPALKTLLRP